MYYLASLQNFLKSAKGLRGFVLGADGWWMEKVRRLAEADGKTYGHGRLERGAANRFWLLCLTLFPLMLVQMPKILLFCYL